MKINQITNAHSDVPYVFRFDTTSPGYRVKSTNESHSYIYSVAKIVGTLNAFATCMAYCHKLWRLCVLQQTCRSYNEFPKTESVVYIRMYTKNIQ